MILDPEKYALMMLYSNYLLFNILIFNEDSTGSGLK